MAALFSGRVAIFDSMAKVNLCLAKGQRREVFKAVMVDGGDPWALFMTTTRSFIGLTSVRTGRLSALKTARCSRSRFVRRSKRYGGVIPSIFPFTRFLVFLYCSGPYGSWFCAKSWLFPDYFVNRHVRFFRITLLNSGHHKDSFTIRSRGSLSLRVRRENVLVLLCPEN